MFFNCNSPLLKICGKAQVDSWIAKQGDDPVTDRFAKDVHETIQSGLELGCIVGMWKVHFEKHVRLILNDSIKCCFVSSLEI